MTWPRRRFIQVALSVLVVGLLGGASVALGQSGPSLVYSRSANRSNPLPLAGAQLTGTVYIFTTPDAGISLVRFWLDGVLRRTENNPPFDFNGGTVSVANPFKVGTLADGSHTIRADMTGGPILTVNFGVGVIATTTTTTTTTTTAPTTTTTQPPTTTTTAAAGLYGAGVSGASLAVPAGAVSVTPATIVSQINSRPAGTAFALQPGVYLLGDLPNKTGNRYYGDPSNHQAVTFDGQFTIEVVWRLQTNNVFANLTFRRYRGLNDAPGNSPFLANGANNVVIRNVEFKDNRLSGLRFGGSGWLADYITSQQNGQYCFGGSGSNHTVDHSLLSQCGVDGLPFAPRFAASDRGISKVNHSTGFTVRNSEIRNIDSGGNGLWFDTNSSGFLIENNYVHDIQRHGIISELNEGGTIRNNTLVHTAYGTQSQEYRDAAIFSNYGGALLIEGNTIDGARNGIVLYQPNRSFPADYANSVCGTVVRNNTIKGTIGNAWTGQHIAVTYEGCNPNSTPGQVTWQNNTEVGSVNHWLNNDATPAQWAARGYS